jgi:hypothetical protein
VGACAHRLGDATGGSALGAGGANPDNARRSGPVPVTLSPGDRRTWRATTGPASSRSAHDPRRVTAGAYCGGGAGHRCGGQRPATGALPRKREQGQAAPPPAARVPGTLRCPVASLPQLVHALLHVPRILASHGLGRSAWRAGGAPLKPVEKVAAARGRGQADLTTHRYLCSLPTGSQNRTPENA